MSTEDQINRRLGKTIAKKRNASGYTQEQVAEVLEIGTEAYSRIERGVNGVSVYKLFLLADMFECGVETFLLEGSGRPSEQAERIAQVLEDVSVSEREFLVDLVSYLARKFKGAKKAKEND